MIESPGCASIATELGHSGGESCRGGQWVYIGADAARKRDRRKRAVTAACERFIADVLKPRFLPEIRTTKFNYPVDLQGRWHGANYRFIRRFRSDAADAIEPEFEIPFARLEMSAGDRFGLAYFRHNGRWWCVYRNLSLNEAFATIESEPIFHPV